METDEASLALEQGPGTAEAFVSYFLGGNNRGRSKKNSNRKDHIEKIEWLTRRRR